MSFSKKTKFALWLYPETLKKVEEHLEGSDCKSKSEFIEQAIIFYCAYLSLDDCRSILPNAVVSAVKGAVDESTNRICRMLFKLAVEQAISSNVSACGFDIDAESLVRLRGACLNAVKKSNGIFTFEQAKKWQN